MNATIDRGQIPNKIVAAPYTTPRADSVLVLKAGVCVSRDRLLLLQTQQQEQAESAAMDQLRAMREVPVNQGVAAGAVLTAALSLALMVLLPARFLMTWFPTVRTLWGCR